MGMEQGVVSNLPGRFSGSGGDSFDCFKVVDPRLYSLKAAEGPSRSCSNLRSNRKVAVVSGEDDEAAFTKHVALETPLQQVRLLWLTNERGLVMAKYVQRPPVSVLPPLTTSTIKIGLEGNEYRLSRYISHGFNWTRTTVLKRTSQRVALEKKGYSSRCFRVEVPQLERETPRRLRRGICAVCPP